MWSLKEMVLMGTLSNSQSSVLSKRPNEHCLIHSSFFKTWHFAEALATFMFTKLAETNVYFYPRIITQKT